MNNTNIKTNNPKESTSKIIKDKNILKNQPSKTSLELQFLDN